MPYKEMCLPNRILSFLTMTSDELRDFLERPPISANPSEIKFLEGGLNNTKKVYAQCVQVMGQLLSLVLPNIDVDSEEITWAYTVVMSRSIQTPEEVLRGGGPGQLIPLFDMMNHAARPVCDLAQPSFLAKPGERARLAAQAAPAQLRVVAAPGEPALLMRGERPLGRLDDCVIIQAPPLGLRAGEEARFEYHPTPFPDRLAKIRFALSYGFCPS